MPRYIPPSIKEIIKPAEWEGDWDLAETIIEKRMVYSYAWVMFFFLLLLIVVIFL